MASDSAVWVVATGNAGKRVEFEQILAGSGIEIRNLGGFGDVSFPEEGTDYRENAIEKARAAAALSTPEGDTVVSYGECTGLILPAPAGEGGFGYDPVFKPDGYDVSMAQIDLNAKNTISHRARALHDLLARWSGTENTPGSKPRFD